MKLDPRIKDISTIRCFNTNNDDCLGKFGYFTNYITNFFDNDNLDKVRKGICVFKDGSNFPFYVDSIENQAFQYFIPERFVKQKEKQLRPYTFMEFTDKFTVGLPIKYRKKGNVGWERYLILNGYSHVQRDDKTTSYIYIGSTPHTLDELFEQYEWQEHYTEDFQPFGVEE